MNLDVSTLIAVVTAAVFTGGQIATLASVVSSNRNQGERIGALEQWRAESQSAIKAVNDQREFSGRVRG